MLFIKRVILFISVIISLPSSALLSEKSIKQQLSSQTAYGIKGAELRYVKIANSTRTYQVKGKSYTILDKKSSNQFTQTGIASYYGQKFHGRKTASGEIFNKNAYTAAHKRLALGSYVLVTNLNNGRQVIVRINDRGPFVHNRIIDLSKGAAKELRMLASGLARVKIEAIQVDAQGYISGKGAETLYQLAKKEGIPLKLKGSGNKLSIKAK